MATRVSNFPTYLNRMILSLIMKTEDNFWIRKNAKIYSILWSYRASRKKSAFLKIAAQAFEDGEISLTFSEGFGLSEAHFLTKNFSLSSFNEIHTILYINSCN